MHSESLALNGGAPTVRTFAYNAANRISSAGYSYSASGNLLSDGAGATRADALFPAPRARPAQPSRERRFLRAHIYACARPVLRIMTSIPFSIP